MDYGHFSADGREYIITRPDTPRPWSNCLTNGSYTSIVTQTGGGYSYIGGPGYDRITRADPDIATSGSPGRYVYVKDNKSGEFFSIGWQPTNHKPDWYECRHAPGVTTVASSAFGLTGRITYFVPLDDNLEVWRVRIENNRSEPADLSLFTYVEWVLGNYMDDLDERQTFDGFNTAYFSDNYIVATKRAWRRPDTASVTLRELRPAGGPKFLPETISSNQSWGKWAFIALSMPVDGYDCDKEVFTGRYGSLGSPAVVKDGQCKNSDGSGRDSVGVLQTHIQVQPGQSVTMDVFVGVVIHDFDPSGVVARYTEPGFVDAKLEAVHNYWKSRLSAVEVDTPDEHFNTLANTWAKYQSQISTMTSGMSSLYNGGASVIGFREYCFDMLGLLPVDPLLAKHKMVAIMQHQYKDGSTLHYWEPRSDSGPRAGHLDDPLWLVYALVSFIKETGDVEFLDDRVGFYYSSGSVTMFEHMAKALSFCLSQLGPRGLVLLGPGDWNDSLDEAGNDGKGESVLTSLMLCQMLAEGADIAGMVGDRVRQRSWLASARDLRAKIEEHCWDGAWYIRATTDAGTKIGSKSDSPGRIYLPPQCWAVISGAASVERAAQAMKSVTQKLTTEVGPALFLPAYEKANSRIGTITRYAPGIHWNGGVSAIAACWAAMAECRLGYGTQAYQIITRLLYTDGIDQDRRMSEPYAIPEFIAGPDSDTYGRGSFTWTGGAASWIWRVCTDWICGVRPEHNGLRVDPCIPRHWKEFSITRPFRGATYRIAVQNPKGSEYGVKQLSVDGKKIAPTDVLPIFEDDQVHDVVVVM